MIEGMTFNNIHIDHIKPVSRFNLQNEDEFLDCCHCTNLQPLLALDNLINRMILMRNSGGRILRVKNIYNFITH